jgi:proteasome lid subunit RPN8/RPN11
LREKARLYAEKDIGEINIYLHIVDNPLTNSMRNVDTTRSIILEAGCFSNLIISAVEVYSKETTGLLIGKHDRRFIRGRLTNCVTAQAAYPLQTAWRGFTSVMIGSKRAFRRARRTLSHLGFELLGEYHSHPMSSARLSIDDEDYIRDQISERDEEELKHAKKLWLELIIGIKKKNYTKAHEMGWFPKRRPRHQKTRKVAGVLKTTPKIGYDIEIMGYWIDLEKIYQTDVYYSPY